MVVTTQMERSRVRRIMWRLVDDHVEASTGEVNCTSLAEATALEMDKTEWLDEPEHDLWLWAYEVAEEYEQQLEEQDGEEEES